jgi:2-oxoglutarate decarboxylase
VAIVPKDSSTSAPEADFGANDWLLEEMYERYTTDPSSVDETWAEYFNSHGAPGAGAGDGAAAKKQEPKPETAAKAPASRREPTPTTAAPAPAPAQASPAAQPPPAPAASRPGPTVEKPSPTKEIRPSAPGARGGVPADPPTPVERKEVPLEEPTKTTLRGTLARTAKNMDVSLTVPTATSVRSLPVKLLIDQRVVINNHLRRARGGKVSYTHIIGFAMVQALRTVPAMNNGSDVVDG